MTLKTAGIQIPFHRADLGEEEIAAVTEVIRSGWLTMGPKTIQFEEEFARYVNAPHAVAVSSCTAALHLALDAIGLRPGDEVLVPTTTFTATAEVMTYLGCRPVFVDVDPETLNIDPRDAEQRITSRTRAIIPVHLAGQPCDMSEIHELAERKNLRIIEDAAHALPAVYRDQSIGSLSEFTAFSFYATKTLTTGEGGMITTENATAADRMRMMRLHGIERDGWKRYTAEGSWHYAIHEAGYKYNFTDLQAALGLVQLRKCDAMWQARRHIAERYTRAFQAAEGLQPPIVRKDRQGSWHLYVLRLNLEKLAISRNQFIDQLAQRGIGASVHFIPLHLQPYYQREFGYRPGDFPNAESQYVRSISLPIYPTMSEEEVEQVIDAVTSMANHAMRPSPVGQHATAPTA
ncbi:MAG TPA: DegT/DnrJ/EryC1/StrS family aminotransferase [Candidatus Acidoferrales bacterium]|nr:DegT/DnrJ/EryC1/StrS family aminotransferase [Candidatus Acidoferrales bacterium]